MACLNHTERHLQRSGLDVLTNEQEKINQDHDTVSLKVVDFNLQEFREILRKIHDSWNVFVKISFFRLCWKSYDCFR